MKGLIAGETVGSTMAIPGLHAGMISVGPTKVTVDAAKAPMISSTKVL